VYPSNMSPNLISLEKLNILLPSQHLEKLAIEYKVDAKNQVRLTGKLVFLCLLSVILYGKDITLRMLEENYLQQTGQHADHSSFGARLTTIKPDYFKAIFEYIYQKMAYTATKGEIQSLKLRFVDATTVTLSSKLMTFGLLVGSRSKDKSHRHVKSVMELSEGLPQFLHLCKDQTECCDSEALGKTMARHAQPGDLFIFDKGCTSRDRLLDLHILKTFFLTPRDRQGLSTDKILFTLPHDLIPTDAPSKDLETDKDSPDLVVTQVSTGVFANDQVKETKRFSVMPLVIVTAVRYDIRSKSWKSFTLLTNLDLVEKSPDLIKADDLPSSLFSIGPYTYGELCDVYSRRWDIEVFFKFIKQHLNFSHLTNRSENGIRVMIYMSLIVSLILLWYKQESKIDRGWRSVKSWLAFDLQTWLKEAYGEAFSLLVEAHPSADNFYLRNFRQL
jgi:hypothetical protein